MSANRSRGWLAFLLITSTAAVSSAETVTVCLSQGDRLALVQREVPSASARAALEALMSGANPDENAAGIGSAIPRGTRLERLDIAGGAVSVELSAEVLAGLDEGRLEAMFRQINRTLAAFDLDSDVSLTVGGRSLSIYLPAAVKPAHSVLQPALPPVSTTSLAGRSVTVSPGHGIFWNGSGWFTQRPVYCSPLNQEDFHNLEMCQYLETYLLADGATVKMVRCTNKSFGNHGAGYPWWQMAAYLWLQNTGYPCSVYANYTGDCTTGSGGSESNDDIRARPLASDFDGTDIYVALHTNGYQGDCTGSCPTGTETYYDASAEHQAWAAVSQTLANNINGQIMSALTSHVDPSWTCHGTCVKNSNGAYGEIRIPDRAATLTELAFHDTCDRDADANHLRDNFFRSAAMWGMYKGICDYFGSPVTWAFYSDEYVSDTIPTTMTSGQVYSVSITYRNRGVLWKTARAFRLGAVGDSDPFTAFNRVDIAGEVGPGATYTFNFQMTAPAAGDYVSDWQMVRDGVTWFGATVAKNIHVNPAAPDTEPPTTPTNLVATATSSTSVQLTWTASTDNYGVAGYEVRRDGGVIGTSGTNSYTDNTCSPDTTYSYEVRAFDAVPNYSGWSSPAVVTTPGDTTPPAPPTGLVASAGNAVVNLDWSDNGEADLAGYNIYRGTTSGGPYSQINGALVAGSSYSDTTVSNGTTYYYVVTAVDTNANESGNSNQASATPQAPDTVTIVTATFTNKTKTLLVEATSSQQPSAVLTVVGYGQMTWKNNRQLYTFSKKPTTNPGTVTVTSSLGGSATATVTVK